MRRLLGGTHPARSRGFLRAVARLLLLTGAAALAYVLLSLLSGPAQAGPAEEAEPGRAVAESPGRGLLDVPLADDLLSTVLGPDDPPEGPPEAPDDAESVPPADPAESSGESSGAADQADPPVAGPSHGDPEAGSDTPDEPAPTAGHGNGGPATGDSERAADREPVAPLPAVDLIHGPLPDGPDTAATEWTASIVGNGHRDGSGSGGDGGPDGPLLPQVRLDVTEPVEQLVTVVDPGIDPLVDPVDLVTAVDAVVTPLEPALALVGVTVTGGDPVSSGPVAVETVAEPPPEPPPPEPTGARPAMPPPLGPDMPGTSAPHRPPAADPAASPNDSDRGAGRGHPAPGNSPPVSWPAQNAGAGQDSGKPWPWVGAPPTTPPAGACRPVVRGCAVPPGRAVPVAVSPG